MKNISQYWKERDKWVENSKPLRSQEEIDELYKICSTCEHYKPIAKEIGKCKVCGCGIKRKGKHLNKLAWSTTRCPLDDPKWVESVETVENNSGEPVQKKKVEKVVQPKKSGGCGCNKKKVVQQQEQAQPEKIQTEPDQTEPEQPNRSWFSKLRRNR